MTKRKHIPEGKVWDELVASLNESMPEENHKEFAHVYKLAHDISEEQNLLPDVIVPVIKRVYNDVDSKKRQIIVNDMKLVIQKLIDTEEYKELDKFEIENGHIDIPAPHGLDYTGSLLTLITKKLEEQI